MNEINVDNLIKCFGDIKTIDDAQRFVAEGLLAQTKRDAATIQEMLKALRLIAGRTSRRSLVNGCRTSEDVCAEAHAVARAAIAKATS